MSPRRVLWVVKGLGIGGAEQLLVLAAENHDPQRARFDVAYVLDWKDALVERLAAAGVRVHALGVSTVRDPRWLVRLRTLVVHGDYEIVHFHSPLVASMARPMIHALPAGTRPVIVSTEHNRWSSYRTVTRLANAATASLNDVHLAVSEEARATMPARLRGNVEVVVYGIDVERVRAFRPQREPAHAQLGVSDDEVVIGTVANLRAQKGYVHLLRAAAELVALGRPVRFVAIGQGPQRDELRALHDELGLGDRFVFLGFQPDALRFVAAFDVFTLPSVHEGFPIALLEAMAMGLPVVVTRAGGMPTAVDDGVEGFVVPPADPAALASALDALVGDPARRRTMAAAASARGATFTITRALRRLEDLYDAVAPRRRPAVRSRAS